MQLTPIPQSATMSSREIADLSGASHDNVLKTIRALIAEGGVFKTTPQQRKYMHSQNRQIYSEFVLGYRDTMVVVSAYSAPVRAKIIDRWQELEAQQAPAFKVPTTLSGALRLAAEQAETIEAQQLQIEAQKPSVEFVERYTVADSGSKGFREVCKLLKANESKFRDWLLASKIMYRLSGVLTAHQNHIDAGRFEVKTGEANGHAFNACKFTPKGVTWVAGEWAKFNLPC